MKKICVSVLITLFTGSAFAQKFVLGTSSYVWENPTVEGYKEGKQLGFEYLEMLAGDYGIGNYDQIVAGSQAAKERMDKAGVKAWSIHLPYGSSYDISSLDQAARKTTVERLKDYIKACAEVFRPKVVRLHPSAEPNPDSERAQRIANSIESIKELKTAADEAGVVICVENLPRTCLGNTPEELLQIVTAVPGVKICFDTNHYLKGTMEHFVRTAGHLIETIHIADYDFNDEKHWLPTEGKVGWGELFHELQEAGYKGIYMNESGSTNDGKVASIQQLKEAYDKAFAEYEELKHPAKRLKAYLEGIKKQYFADIPMDSVFCTGTAPGYYQKAAFEKFKKTYNTAQKSVAGIKTAAQSKVAREKVRVSLNNLLKAVNPVTDGYYWLQSANTGFAAQNKTMACYTDESNLLKWKAFEPSLKFLFKITKEGNNLYSIRNMYSDTYVYTVEGRSASVPMNSRQLVGQNIQPFNKFGIFSLYNANNAIPYHAKGHNDGVGLEGHVITWNGVAGSGSSWHLRPVDETEVNNLLE